MSSSRLPHKPHASVIALPPLPGKQKSTQKCQLDAAQIVLEQLLFLREYLPLPVQHIREYLKIADRPDSPTTEPINSGCGDSIQILDEMCACEDEDSMQVDDGCTSALESSSIPRPLPALIHPADHFQQQQSTATQQSCAMAQQVAELGGRCLQKCTQAVFDVDEAFTALNNIVSASRKSSIDYDIDAVVFVFGATLQNPAEVYEVQFCRSGAGVIGVSTRKRCHCNCSCTRREGFSSEGSGLWSSHPVYTR